MGRCELQRYVPSLLRIGALLFLAVCKTDDACVGFPLAGKPVEDGEEINNMTCYKGGVTVFENHQMCAVTSAYIDLCGCSGALIASRSQDS